MPTWQEKINAKWLINMRHTLVDVDCLQNIRQIHKTEVVKASRAKWKFVDGFSSLVFLSIDHKISTQPYKHNKYLSWIRNKQTRKTTSNKRCCGRILSFTWGCYAFVFGSILNTWNICSSNPRCAMSNAPFSHSALFLSDPSQTNYSMLFDFVWDFWEKYQCSRRIMV